MKNLTHYFTSPKEEETDNKSPSILVESSANCDIQTQNTAAKKRKINLSKSKANNYKNNVGITEIETKIEHENKIQDNTNKKNKKRKITEENDCEKINVSSKKVKLGKSKSSKLKIVKDNSSDERNGNIPEKSNKQSKIIESSEVVVSIESSNSCDEPLAKTKRKHKNLFLESDEDTAQSFKFETSDISKNSTENSSVTVKNPNSTRNSLLGYFNKVDKETALKEKKPEIIKVEAQVHIPPAQNNKLPRFSLSKLPKKSKTNKMKQTSDYDCIEVLSTEDISDSEEGKSQSIEVSDKTECEEVALVDIKEQINGVKVKTINIASIFILKKIDKKDIISPPNTSANDENILLPEDVQNDTQSKKKKSLRIKKISKNCVQNDENIPKNNINKNSIKTSSEKQNFASEKETKQKKSEVVNKSKNELTKETDKNGFVTPCDNINGVTNVSETQIPNEKTVEASLEIDQASINKTLEYKKTHETPKKKSCNKINGYFTPKISRNSYEDKDSAEKVHMKKKSPSAWVMKVRLSATKSRIGSDSDDDSKDSIQEEAKKDSQKIQSDVETKEIEISRSDRKEDDEIVVVDEEEESKNQENNATRKSLFRSVKNLKYSEDKVKSTKETVIVVDEEDDSNSSQENNKKKTRVSRSAKTLKYTEEKSEPTKQPVKMWPFFQKGGTRQTKDPPVDQEKLKAKQLFLESGVPEVLKKKVEIEKSEGVVGVPAPFPTISHITQTDVASTKEALSFFFPRQHCLSSSPITPVWSSLLPTDNSDEPEIPVFQRPQNVKACLDKLKEEEPKTEVKTLYKCLKEYKNKADSDIWTEVYKPNKSADIVGNSENIKKLKTWLETFKNRKRREGSVSSGDEFINEDSDEEGNSINNLAVVSGPTGCGKTCAVYAIAAELDCKVLEINASCNRSGKRILAEFSESTQSHQVERTQSMNGLLNQQNSGKSKKKKKFKKTNEAKSGKTSLILVEDADLLFTDADEGYMQALSSLAATAKRPIILVTNQTKNPHLERFQSSRPLHLTFCKPKPYKLELWLRLIGLVEGVEVSAEQAKCLVAWSGCDVRRALLQLQLMVHSNNSEMKKPCTQSDLWWRWPLTRGLQYELPTLLEPEELPQPPQVDKAKLLRDLEEISQATSRLAYLDSLSTRCSHQLLMPCDRDDPCPTSWAAQCTDSTAQTQCLLDPVHSTGTQLADWLAETVAGEGLAATDRPGWQSAQEARWLTILRQSEQMFLSGVSTTVLSNHSAVACEYMPTLRAMGRAEQVRLTNYSRRANRFFNYLQGLGIHASKSYRDFMCDAFS